MTTITTLSGTYQTGMKRENAKDKTEFDRIDLLDGKKTGTLSNMDICNERDNEARKMAENKKSLVLGCACLGGVGAGIGATGIGTVPGILMFGLGFGAAIILDDTMSDGSEEMRETQKYRRGLDVSM